MCQTSIVELGAESLLARECSAAQNLFQVALRSNTLLTFKGSGTCHSHSSFKPSRILIHVGKKACCWVVSRDCQLALAGDFLCKGLALGLSKERSRHTFRKMISIILNSSNHRSSLLTEACIKSPA